MRSGAWILLGAAACYDPALTKVDGAGTADGSAIDAAAAADADAAPDAGDGRVTDGLVVLYDFAEGKGMVVRDTGPGAPLDLEIRGTGAVWLPDRLSLTDTSTLAISPDFETKVRAACSASLEITIEAWVNPSMGSAGGVSPTRVVTSSADPLLRNFTLGRADAGAWEARVRTEATSENGQPGLVGGTATLGVLHHVVFTHRLDGYQALYVNGELATDRTDQGAISSWEPYVMALGNEPTLDRAYRGDLHLVAIYDRALTEDEIGRNLAAGDQAP